MSSYRTIGGVTCGLLLGGIATAQQPSQIKTSGPDALEFSVINMDRSVSPRSDFLRYAAGGWLDRVRQPADLPSFGYFDVMTERTNRQAGALVDGLIAPGKSAAPGTPAQQIGTLYRAFMDEKAIDQAGLKPLQGELDKLAAVGRTASATIGKFTLAQLKEYMALRLIQTFSPVLTSKFEPPKVAVNKALFGAYSAPPRSVAAVNLIKSNLGQPLGRLFTERHFSHAQQARALDMVKRVQAEFRKRMVANDWMSDTTRKAALEKVDKLYYRVGYPDEWVDYSAIRIGGDLVQDLINIHKFEVARGFADLGGPTRHWAFTDPLHTLPTVINAAYNPSINGFEVTAAITQPPAYQPDMDAAVNFCRLGAVIGHEMTHGFDTGGRNFDPSGNMRNWWTDADAKRFGEETQKLIDLGDHFEALPGTFMKGGLTVTENLADIGGITLAYDALNQYLAEHPAENVKIDGLTPQQRCFIAWSQFWAEKRTAQAMRVQLEDNHAPGVYRAVAPLQQVPGFYEAFGIKPGDPMWLDPAKRVHIW